MGFNVCYAALFSANWCYGSEVMQFCLYSVPLNFPTPCLKQDFSNLKTLCKEEKKNLFLFI